MYFGLSQQSKHSRDIAAILKSKKDELDISYIEQWASRYGRKYLPAALEIVRGQDLKHRLCAELISQI